MEELKYRYLTELCDTALEVIKLHWQFLATSVRYKFSCIVQYRMTVLVHNILVRHGLESEVHCVKMHVFQEQQRLKALDEEFHRKLAIEMKKVIS